MKCLFYFKDKSKTKKPNSAPELEGGRKSGNSPIDQRVNKSSRSISSTPSISRSLPDLYEEKAHNLRIFSLAELRTATNDFSHLLKIGSGGFGNVYKGHVEPPNGEGNRILVAIKKLNKDSLQGHKHWKAEVLFLAVVEHPNLVKLVGYCSEDDDRGSQRLLVYEYVPNGTLDNHLFSRALPPLPWILRLQIVLGAAQGLAYLHEGLELQVIYRDFKASNVLLDNDFKPRLSDFGLAREGPKGGHTHVSTSVVGTYGYAAPDYVQTGRLTAKSDVWSFGVVLYEILTGRRSLERNRPKAEQRLLEWVKQYPTDTKSFTMIMDPRLGNCYSLSAARAIAKLAESCLAKNAKTRPNMNEVIESLKQAIETSETERSQNISVDHNSASTSHANKKPLQVNRSDYSRRQMDHLAKLKQNANAVGRRRFVIMPSASGQ